MNTQAIELPLGSGLDSIDGDLEAALSAGTADLVRRIVRGELSRSRFWHPEDVDDVCSDCMVALLSQALLGQREDLRTGARTADPIEDFHAYVAVIARRACSAWSRRKHPEFHRLRTRLRYLLRNDRRFALWQNQEKEWVCGFAGWKTEGRLKSTELNEDPVISSDTGEAPAKVLSRIFDQVGRPLHFNDLARICARCWGIVDTPQSVELLPETAVPERNLDAEIYRERRLKQVWEQIGDLPAPQRMALLLNMTGPDGECGTSLLVMTGTVSPRELAGAIGMDAGEFAELLVRLPLNDQEIAGRMGISRQQVINLRKCARERLRRRMKESDGR